MDERKEGEGSESSEDEEIEKRSSKDVVK